MGSDRKAELYLELSQSTTLTDPSYWLQTLFAAGIATLGLVLNSPAVIIGAMLISPLMGLILASGLALATGDVILGLRSALNLIVSCVLAVAFAFLLVTVLPFKEITNEIAVRTHPTTLDLAVAFFSGAIGSIATCKEVKGVVTSIPGVAIAVALMPPLGVAGYGIAVAASINTEEGMRVALGGGLLFLTNLVAITFTAMLVFLALHIDAADVKGRIEEWHQSDTESVRFRRIFSRLPGVPGVRSIGTLPGRLLMILIIIAVILIPLSRSFNQLKYELSEQKKENQIRQLVTQTWQKEFGKLPSGESRSFLDHVTVADHDGKLTLQLRVLTSKPLSATEKDRFHQMLASNLSRPTNSLETQIVEIPTAAAALRLRPTTAEPELPPSVSQLQANLFERIDRALTGMYLPPPAKFIDYQINNKASERLEVALNYLSDRDIDPDAQALMQQDARTRLDYPEVVMTFLRVPVSIGKLNFRGRQSTLDRANEETLNKAGAYLKQHSNLRLEIVTDTDQARENEFTRERLAGIKDLMASRFQIADSRIVTKGESGNGGGWLVILTLIQ